MLPYTLLCKGFMHIQGNTVKHRCLQKINVSTKENTIKSSEEQQIKQSPNLLGQPFAISCP